MFSVRVGYNFTPYNLHTFRLVFVCLYSSHLSSLVSAVLFLNIFLKVWMALLKLFVWLYLVPVTETLLLFHFIFFVNHFTSRSAFSQVCVTEKNHYGDFKIMQWAGVCTVIHARIQAYTRNTHSSVRAIFPCNAMHFCFIKKMFSDLRTQVWLIFTVGDEQDRLASYCRSGRVGPLAVKGESIP